MLRAGVGDGSAAAVARVEDPAPRSGRETRRPCAPTKPAQRADDDGSPRRAFTAEHAENAEILRRSLSLDPSCTPGSLR